MSPTLILAMWAAGIAGAAAFISWQRVVGRGFFWLASGVVMACGGATALAGNSTVAALGVGAALAGGLLGSRATPAGVSFATSGVLFLIAAAADGGPVLSLSGSVALGGVSAEMLLGHWYLVDPRLPRWPLKRLAVAGAIGLVADFILLAVARALPYEAGDPLLGWVWLVAAAVSLILMVGVWFSLREPSYSGVMAATGLSYLAVLTSLAAVSAGRVALAPETAAGLGRIAGL